MSNSILIVDDHDDLLLLLRLVLESDGYKVTSAQNSWEAVNLLEKIHPKLILLDVMMPNLDGLRLTKIIRSTPEFSAVPILLVTADREITEQQARQIGADGIIHKPYDLDELLKRVQAIFCSSSVCSIN